MIPAIMEYENLPKLEVESDGFVTSFALDDTEDVLSFFRAHGFVVIRDVLSNEECEVSCDEVWTSLLQMAPGVIKRDEPQTWGECNWPRGICRNGGFMGKFPYFGRMESLKKETLVANQSQAWRNRQNPKVWAAFATVMGTRELYASIDRYGIMRPTLRSDSEDWRTGSDWLHWDLSPFHFGTSAAGFGPRKVDKGELRREYGGLRVQGMINLTDCPTSVGGFHCVPGFQKHFFEWRDANMEGYGAREDIKRRNFVEVPREDTMRRHVKKVPMPRGSLLIWNSMLPHGNFPNSSNEHFRMVQYIKMIPRNDPREFEPAMTSARFHESDWFPTEPEAEGFAPSKLGRCLFGLDDWDSYNESSDCSR